MSENRDLKNNVNSKVDPLEIVRKLNREIILSIQDNGLPKKYIINKNATVLIWNNGEKTIIKRNEEDKHNPKLAFLIAFFQYYSRLSKKKANEFLDNLVEDKRIN